MALRSNQAKVKARLVQCVKSVFSELYYDFIVVVKKVFLVICVCAVIALAIIVAPRSPSLQSNARRAWKENAIREIVSRTSDASWPWKEIAELKKQTARDGEIQWLTENLIVMRNGDWLAYKNICNKQNHRIHDLFLAQGSDGRWHYSTYHFCKDMVVLRMEDQAENLAEFINKYSLRSFDGRSDECLQSTWPQK
jgi:hypothetical protein